MIDLNKIHQGDALKILKSWPDNFVQTVVTSPPYWGLRDYGIKGQIGLEDNIRRYVRKMVRIFREVGRVMKNDGTLWMNLGDTYNSKPTTNGISFRRDRAETVVRNKIIERGTGRWGGGLRTDGSLKPKDLCGIPWRVALALQRDGWYLRSDIIWAKDNPMPESVRDRPTKSHEYIFLLTKSQRYFYDAEAIKEPLRDESILRRMRADLREKEGWEPNYFGNPPTMFKHKKPTGWGNTNEDRRSLTGRFHAEPKAFDATMNGGGTSFKGHKGYKKADGTLIVGTMANKRTVWTVATQGFRDAHFATFPEDLILPCIKAGSRPGDVVLDPFMGSGTTAVVAKRYKRQWVGIDLNPQYIAMADKRIAGEHDALLVE